MLTAKVRPEKFDRAIRRYIDDLGAEAGKVVTTQARLLLEKIISFTPPKNLAKGRGAVARDIRRAMNPLDPNKIRNPKLRKQIANRDFAAVNAFFSSPNAGGFKGYRAFDFSPQIHTGARNRLGRVTRRLKIAVFGFQEAKAYLRKVQSAVGAAKAGFWPALQKLGGSLPSWVTRHNPAAYGQVIDARTDKKNPRIRIVNTSIGVATISQSAIQNALDSRAKAMTTDVNRALKGLATNFNRS